MSYVMILIMSFGLKNHPLAVTAEFASLQSCNAALAYHAALHRSVTNDSNRVVISQGCFKK